MKQAIQNLTNRITRIGLALFIAFWQVAVPVFTTQTVSAKSNNGTFKVHEYGTPSGDETVPGTPNNDPKVCHFNFEAFNLDPSQTGDVTIETQSGPAITPLVVPLQTNETGYGETAYINAPVGSLVLPDGHYKATLDTKFGTDPGDKAKSKVFKVECEDSEDPEDPEVGSVKVNKLVDLGDGNGFVGDNPSQYGFVWGLDNDVPENVMGSTQSNVSLGQHQVHENVVNGYELVGWYVNGDAYADCSAEGRNEGPVSVDVVADETVEVTLCNQAAPTEEPQEYSIHGFKFHDLNQDGEFNEAQNEFAQDEEKLAGWTIFIDENANGTLDDDESSVVTNADGNFSFDGLVDGTYRVCEVQQAGWVRMFPAASDCQDVTVSGEDEADVRFGNYQVDPCDYQQLLAATTRGDVKARLTQLGVTGEDCFEVEISKECSVLDVKVQHTVRNGDTPWSYAAYHKLTDLKQDGTFPLIFDEDYNNGSVSVDWQVLGTENDYVSLWDATGSEVVDTDCAEPVVPTPEEPKTPGQVLGDNTEDKFEPQVLSANTLANTGEKYDVRQTVFAGTIIIAATAMGFTSRRKQTDR